MTVASENDDIGDTNSSSGIIEAAAESMASSDALLARAVVLEKESVLTVMESGGGGGGCTHPPSSSDDDGGAAAATTSTVHMTTTNSTTTTTSTTTKTAGGSTTSASRSPSFLITYSRRESARRRKLVLADDDDDEYSHHHGQQTITRKRSAAVGRYMELCEFRLAQRRPPAPCDAQRYQHTHPLVYEMLQTEESRTRRLQKDGAKQIFYPKSNEGWWTSLRVMEGRALKSVFPVWCLVVFHAILYTCIHELVTGQYNNRISEELASWETFFGIALNATLGLMLVFRLNRAATRWWIAREFWGKIIAKIRVLASGVLVHHGSNDICGESSVVDARRNTDHRDNAIRWLAAYALSTMEFLRGQSELDVGLFEGILTKDQVFVLQEQRHPPLFAAHQVRHYLKCIFRVTADTPVALSNAYSQQLATLEEQWTVMLDCCGGMERIRATPLPIVYVSHLRTFLILSLLLYPYVWGYEWRWSTIPIVALSGFLMLGIEAASSEVEQPFKKDRVNALNMDGFCIGLLSNILQLIRQQADRELEAAAAAAASTRTHC